MNVNKMLAISDLEPPKQGLFRSRWQGDTNPTESISHYVDQIVLTNEKEAMHSQYYFNSFEIINKAMEEIEKHLNKNPIISDLKLTGD